MDEQIAELVASGVSRSVDVRLNPISRKPGLSKTALGRALAAAGIGYEHPRELGNPKANLPGFGGTMVELREARARHRALLLSPEGSGAIDAVVRAARAERVAVLCFEADAGRCHRDVLLAVARPRLVDDLAGGHPAR